jgi:hypothetical protein
LAFPGDVTYACTNIQLTGEEDDTPNIDTWRNARVWVDFFGDFHSGKKIDIRERNVTIRSEI